MLNSMNQIDTYLAKLDPPQAAQLERIRKIVKKTIPEAEEAISYGMPAFKYKTKYLIGYAAFKNHMSIFPASNPVVAMKKKLTKFKLSKGTIQFTLDNPIPEAIIKELVTIRREDILG